MEKLASLPVRQLLQERRRYLNSLFLQARVNYPRLNGEDFLAHVRDTVVPVLERVQAHDSTRATVVLEAIYEISLRLVAQGAMGPNARSRVAEHAWRQLLETSSAMLCQEPTLIARSVANALLHLSAVDADRAVSWQKAMASLVPHVRAPREWLDAGLVMAWCSGLSHYRESALAKARELDPRVGSVALGLAQPLSQEAYENLLARMRVQPWLRPQEHLSGAVSKPELRTVGWVGGFIGFGGQFATPPKAVAQGERLLLCDDRNTWYLAADCFGSLLQRADGEVIDTTKRDAVAMRLTNDGIVLSPHGPWQVDAAAGAFSYAASATTMVVVPKHSHRALVLGLRLPYA